ncbi:hypothetical protein [Hyphomicrobium sp.]|uniref:hypothetical protein n=1 Tax=Hyphomicrobium sp. TaxID=82 RepID=UPI002E2FA22F|nr:hypothetical protein [Hyphomicrobium sp.]
MAGGTTSSSSVLAEAVVLLAVILLALGGIWYGASTESLQRMWHDLTGRPAGPMSFRFILQPIMATVAAIGDGLNDARLGRSPYFWTVLSNPTKRGARLQEGLVSTARIILLGLGMDAIYQMKVFGTFYPVEALIVALVLAFVPYLLIRGPVERLASRWMQHSSTGSAT